MTEHPKVSVILTSYNHAKYLRESIESALNQEFSDFELILWDDASSDESWQIIKSYSDPRIRAFQSVTNTGAKFIGKAILEVAVGEYIAIHHSDDVWEPQKLKEQVAFLDGAPQIGAVFSRALIIKENGDLLDEPSHPYYSIFDQPNRTRFEWLNHFFYHGNALCHPSILIRKQCYIDCGVYRFGLAQVPDFDMWVRLCLKYEIHVLPEKLVRFRVLSGEANTSGNRPETHVRGQFEFIQIAENYLNIDTPEEFLKVFPTASDYFKPAGFDIGYALGMTALTGETFNAIKLFSLSLLFEIMNDPDRRAKVWELYGFGQRDFVRLTGSHDVFSIQQLTNVYTHLAGREQTITVLEQDLIETRRNFEQTIHALEQQLSETTQELTGTTQKLTETTQELIETTQELIGTTQELTGTTQKLTETGRDLAEITGSKAWKVVMSLRRFRIILAPPDSFRARMLDRVVFGAFSFFKKAGKSGKLKQNSELIRTSGLYDKNWYLANYPDVAGAKVEPLLHYLRTGGYEGRDPGPNFASAWYLTTYGDVKQDGMNPLVHYLMYGREQGYQPQPEKPAQAAQAVAQHSLPPGAQTNDSLKGRQDVAGASFRADGKQFLVWAQDWLSEHATSRRLVKRLLPAGVRGRLNREVRDKVEISSNVTDWDAYEDVKQHSLPPGAQWIGKNDSTALVALQGFLDKLKLHQLSNNEVLSALKNALAKDKYYQVLKEIFTLEQFFATPLDRSTIYPIIQTLKLPEITGKVRRRRILFITSQFPSPYHGGGNRVLNFIKILSQNNDIYLSSSFFSVEDESVFHLVEPYCKSIQTIPFKLFGGNQAKILAWLNGTQMDIVHYEWPRSLENYNPDFGKTQIFTYMEAVSLRLKIDLERAVPFSFSWVEIFAELAYALRLELVDAAQVTARIAVTTKDGEFFKDLYPYQTYAILNHGLTFDEFELPDIEPEAHTLVFVGNYRHYPNVDAMVFFFNEMWADICREVPDARIYLVGPNLPENLIRYADGQHVIVTGCVPDIRPYIQKATIGIAPLITGAGLRGKVIDYAALHRTFVCTSLAVTDLIFEDTIDFFCADTASEFAQKIITLLKDDKLVSQMSASAFKTAKQNYDNYRLTDFLTRFYKHLEV